MLDLSSFLRGKCNYERGRCRDLLPRTSCLDQHRVTFVTAQGETLKKEADFSAVTVLQARGTLGVLEHTTNSKQLRPLNIYKLLL